MRQTIILAVKNLFNKPLNLLLSLILFALGVGLISFLLLFNSQLKEKFEANLAGIDLVIGAKGSPLQLILCNMYHIDNPTGNINIKDAKPFLNPRHPLIKLAVPLSLGDNYRSFRIVGTNHDILKLYNASLDQGKLWADELEVTLGASVAEKSGLKVGDLFVSSHGFDEDPDLAHDHAKFKVVGTLKPSGTVVDQLILTRTSSIWTMHAHEAADTAEAGHVHETAMDTTHAHDNSNLDLLAHPDEQITSILVLYKSSSNYQALNMPRAINENTAMQAASPAYEINKLYSMIGTGTETIRYIALLIAFVSMISIFISLYRSMKERKYELALLRVMGSGRGNLFGLILVEGVFIALLGWLLGTVLSHVGMAVLGHYMSADFRYNFSATTLLTDEWWLLVISLLLGGVAAIIPAWSAARTDINKTLGEK
ncbi:MAG: FtsX-like permease family protein [Saprospiraceae bacterium]|nr:FtsX-like permease family protein [Saprospiraceae bacterium]